MSTPLLTRSRAATLVLAALLGLTACVTPPRPRGPEVGTGSAPDLATLSWPERRSHLQTLGGYALRGRVAVAAGEEGFSGSVRWQQSGAQSEVALDGPLGIGGLKIDVLADRSLILTTARGERLDGVAARAALEQQIGFPLPVESLRYWLLGVPAPTTAASEQLAPAGPRLDGLEQDGWTVRYQDYIDTPFGERPRRLTVVRGAARLRVVVESWMPARAGA